MKNDNIKKLNSKKAGDASSFNTHSGTSPTRSALKEPQRARRKSREGRVSKRAVTQPATGGRVESTTTNQLAALTSEQVDAIKNSKCPVCGVKAVVTRHSDGEIGAINCLDNRQPEHLDPIRKLLGIPLRDTSTEISGGLRAEWKEGRFYIIENGKPLVEGSDPAKTLKEFRECLLSSGKPSDEQIQQVRSALIELAARPSVARASNKRGGKGDGRVNEEAVYSDGGYDDGYVWDLCISDDGELTFAVCNPEGELYTTPEFNGLTPTKSDLFTPKRKAGRSAESDIILSGPPALVSEGELDKKIREFIERYCYIPKPLDQAVLAAYINMSWAYDRFANIPYLRLKGEYGSGKSRVLDIIAVLARRGYKVDSTTSAGLKRTVHEYHPTLVIDEFNGDIDSDVASILNGGFAREAKVLLLDKQSDNGPWSPKSLSTFCPKVVGGYKATKELGFESRTYTRLVAMLRINRLSRNSRDRHRLLRSHCIT
jgi:hypothetical protein